MDKAFRLEIRVHVVEMLNRIVSGGTGDLKEFFNGYWDGVVVQTAEENPDGRVVTGREFYTVATRCAVEDRVSYIAANLGAIDRALLLLDLPVRPDTDSPVVWNVMRMGYHEFEVLDYPQSRLVNEYRSVLARFGLEKGWNLMHEALRKMVVALRKQKRRQGREWAMQMLFQLDMNPGLSVDEAIDLFWRQQWSFVHAERNEPPSDGPEVMSALEAEYSNYNPDNVAARQWREFAEARVRGVCGHLDEIDGAIATYAKAWPMHRLGTIERNVLRLAYYEMRYQADDIPAAVVINEAVDLVKYFSDSEAGRFTNGILDEMRRHLESGQETAVREEQ
jgi:transcription antitermination factor NusB